MRLYCLPGVLLATILVSTHPLSSQKLTDNKVLDEKVRTFLGQHAGKWHEMNVSSSDGNLLYDLVLKNHYTSALEIGTSTGHSAIWIAWALSKTGGKLITIEIDKERHNAAVANFKEAGLSDYIDARLADAHDLVRKLPGPFDFVFSDADKEWYKPISSTSTQNLLSTAVLPLTTSRIRAVPAGIETREERANSQFTCRTSRTMRQPSQPPVPACPSVTNDRPMSNSPPGQS